MAEREREREKPCTDLLRCGDLDSRTFRRLVGTATVYGARKREGGGREEKLSSACKKPGLYCPRKKGYI